MQQRPCPIQSRYQPAFGFVNTARRYSQPRSLFDRR
jgi:hypothetical protein